MKKTLKKIAAMLFTALFMVSLLPTGASAAVKPTEPEIEPQDSGYYIYQYYEKYIDVPGTWNTEWSTVLNDNTGIVLTDVISKTSKAYLKGKILIAMPGLNANAADEIAGSIVDGSSSWVTSALNLSLSVTYQKNSTHRPLKYLNHYTISYSIGGYAKTENFYELATLI